MGFPRLSLLRAVRDRFFCGLPGASETSAQDDRSFRANTMPAGQKGPMRSRCRHGPQQDHWVLALTIAAAGLYACWPRKADLRAFDPAGMARRPPKQQQTTPRHKKAPDDAGAFELLT